MRAWAGTQLGFASISAIAAIVVIVRSPLGWRGPPIMMNRAARMKHRRHGADTRLLMKTTSSSGDGARIGTGASFGNRRRPAISRVIFSRYGRRSSNGDEAFPDPICCGPVLMGGALEFGRC